MIRRLALLAALAFPSLAQAKGTMPEDILKGQIIFTDKALPTSWKSVGGFVSQIKTMNKTSIWYDKDTGKVKVEYAAFFARPVDDVQVDLIIYDITGGHRDRKSSTEQFMRRGDRVLFNSILFDKEDFEMNKKYMIAIESKHVQIARGEFILRGEGPHYSGKVTFTDDETKSKQ